MGKYKEYKREKLQDLVKDREEDLRESYCAQ
jgi:hypothetical protein